MATPTRMRLLANISDNDDPEAWQDFERELVRSGASAALTWLLARSDPDPTVTDVWPSRTGTYWRQHRAGARMLGWSPQGRYAALFEMANADGSAVETIQIGRSYFRVDRKQAQPASRPGGIETLAALATMSGASAGWVLRDTATGRIHSATSAMGVRKLTGDDRDRLNVRFGS